MLLSATHICKHMLLKLCMRACLLHAPAGGHGYVEVRIPPCGAAGPPLGKGGAGGYGGSPLGRAGGGVGFGGGRMSDGSEGAQSAGLGSQVGASMVRGVLWLQWH